MKSPHILLASSNVRRLQANIAHIVDAAGQNAIEAEIRSNVRQLFGLGRVHFRFARRQINRNWRQKVSRVYYAAYNVSRAVRLSVDGEFSTESTDHK